MVIEKIFAPQMPKYEEIRDLKESEQEVLIRESYEMEFDSYSSLGAGRGFGPCLVGDINSCRCSKEELERQKVLIELQREKEKLEAERKQRGEERRREIERKKARMEAAWKEWEIKNRQYLQGQEARMPWNRDENWRQGLPKPSSNLDDY